jgi:hypothetical protein
MIEEDLFFPGTQSSPDTSSSDSDIRSSTESSDFPITPPPVPKSNNTVIFPSSHPSEGCVILPQNMHQDDPSRKPKQVVNEQPVHHQPPPRRVLTRPPPPRPTSMVKPVSVPLYGGNSLARSASLNPLPSLRGSSYLPPPATSRPGGYVGDHRLLEKIYIEMHEARFINLAPLSLLANSLSLYFKGACDLSPCRRAAAYALF